MLIPRRIPVTDLKVGQRFYPYEATEPTAHRLLTSTEPTDTRTITRTGRLGASVVIQWVQQGAGGAPSQTYDLSRELWALVEVRDPFTLPEREDGEAGTEYTRRVLGVAVGAASVAWHEDHTFDEQFASSIVDALAQHVSRAILEHAQTVIEAKDIEAKQRAVAESERVGLRTRARADFTREDAVAMAIKSVQGTEHAMSVVYLATGILDFVNEPEPSAEPDEAKADPNAPLTVEQIEALPVGSVIYDKDGDRVERFERGWRRNTSMREPMSTWTVESPTEHTFAPYTLAQQPRAKS